MKLLFLSEGPYFEYYQGAAKANRALLESLVALGYECRVIHLIDQSSSLSEVASIMEQQGADSVIKSTHYIKGTVDGVEILFTSSYLQVYRMIKESLKQFSPDVVMVNMSYHTLVAAAIKAGAGSGSKLIAICHDVLTIPFGPSCWIENPLLREELNQITSFIGVSDYVADYIVRWGNYHNVVSLQFPIYGEESYPFFHNFNRGYIGICNPTAIKGFSIFTQLAEAFPKYSFAAVITWGSLLESEWSKLRELPNVTLLNPEHDMNLIFENIRVWLHPSLCQEALGQTVIEAMLRGIPVLASDQGGLIQAKCNVDYNLPVSPIVQIIKDQYTGNTLPVIPEQNITVWAETLDKILTDESLYVDISYKSRMAAHKFISGIGPEKFDAYLTGLI